MEQQLAAQFAFAAAAAQAATPMAAGLMQVPGAWCGMQMVSPFAAHIQQMQAGAMQQAMQPAQPMPPPPPAPVAEMQQGYPAEVPAGTGICWDDLDLEPPPPLDEGDRSPSPGRQSEVRFKSAAWRDLQPPTPSVSSTATLAQTSKAAPSAPPKAQPFASVPQLQAMPTADVLSQQDLVSRQIKMDQIDSIAHLSKALAAAADSALDQTGPKPEMATPEAKRRIATATKAAPAMPPQGQLVAPSEGKRRRATAAKAMPQLPPQSHLPNETAGHSSASNPSPRGSDGAHVAAESQLGFEWRGRFGWWDEDSVHLLATFVGVFEVALADGARADFDVAFAEINSALDADFKQCCGIRPAALHYWNFSASSTRRQMRVALVQDPNPAETAAQLKPKWQRRPFCNGSVLVTWRLSFDSSAAEHCQRVSSMLRKGLPFRGFSLTLPTRWFQEAECQRKVARVLRKGEHWFDFASNFGDVARAELVFAHAANGTIYLLIEFDDASGASPMYEALTDRYLWYPRSPVEDDVYEIMCVMGDYENLRAPLVAVATNASAVKATTSGLKAVKRSKSEEPIFELRHCSEKASTSAYPPVIRITADKRCLTVGRDDSCDIVLKHPHISKAHASLVLQQDPDDEDGWKFMIQDTSSNGTWVNGARTQKNFMQELSVSECISFITPVHTKMPEDPHLLTYEVACTATSEVLVNKSAKRARAAGRDQKPAGHAAETDVKTEMKREIRSNLIVPKTETGEFACTRQDLEKMDKDMDEIAGAKPSDPHVEDVSSWLHSFGIPSFMAYQVTLEQQFETVSQIRRLYKDNLDAFFEDCQILKSSHRALFKTAIRAHRGSLRTATV